MSVERGPTIGVGRRHLDRGAVITGVAFLVLGTISLVEGIVLGSDPDANRLHQTLLPGLYITVLGAILFAAGLVHLWRNAPVTAAVAGARMAVRRETLPLILALVLYAWLIERLGYIAASIPFFLAILRVFGVRSWRASIILSLLLTAAFWTIFVHYFGVLLPRGILEGIL